MKLVSSWVGCANRPDQRLKERRGREDLRALTLQQLFFTLIGGPALILGEKKYKSWKFLCWSGKFAHQNVKNESILTVDVANKLSCICTVGLCPRLLHERKAGLRFACLNFFRVRWCSQQIYKQWTSNWISSTKTVEGVISALSGVHTYSIGLLMKLSREIIVAATPYPSHSITVVLFRL